MFQRQTFRTAKWTSTLSTYAEPIIGSLLVSDIRKEHVQKVLVLKQDDRRLWLEKTETASKLHQRIEAVLSWATVRG